MRRKKQSKSSQIWQVVERYALYFFVFSMTGWLAEMLVVYIMSGVYVNVGVLSGPWVPIYGWASLLIIYLSRRVKNNFEFFGIVMVVTGLIEYTTSIYLEMAHHARWWDYSALPLNINGRICLWILAIFAVVAVVGVKYIVPLLDMIYQKIHGKIFTVVIVILMLIFAVDWVHSGSHPNLTPGMPSNIGIKITKYPE